MYCLHTRGIQLVITNTLVYQFLALKSLIKDLIDIVLDWEKNQGLMSTLIERENIAFIKSANRNTLELKISFSPHRYSSYIDALLNSWN